MIAIDHDFAFKSARQFEALNEDISWIDVPVAWITITIANVVIAVACVALLAIGAGPAPHFDPRHLYVACFVALQISRVKIKIHKTPPSQKSASRSSRPNTEVMNWDVGQRPESVSTRPEVGMLVDVSPASGR